MAELTKDVVMATRDHVAMLQHREWWAFFPPMLPLKRVFRRGATASHPTAMGQGDHHRSDESLGFILNIDGEPEFRVRIGCIMFRADYQTMPYIDYPDAYAVFEAGWEVD